MISGNGAERDGGPRIRDRHAPLPTRKVLHRKRQDSSEQQYFLYLPGTGAAGAPIFVTIHGLERDAEGHAHLFASFCEAHGALLVAPLFSEDCADYQRLGRAGRGRRADVVLEGLLEEVVLMTGALPNPFYLFGHGAGAQFAHRYAMAHPHRVAAVAATAAGWYTFPQKRRRYPYGIRRSRGLADVRFDPEEFLQVPITVLIGEQDRGTRNLRRTEKLDRQQGSTRLERAQKWVAAMRAATEKSGLEPLVWFESIPGAGGSLRELMKAGLGERVFGALFAPSAQRVGSST